MQVRTQWMRVPTRLLSIPAVTLVVIASLVIALSKLSIAAASDDAPAVLHSFPRLEKALPTVSFDGIASYYGHSFHGRRTAHGSRFNMYDFTAAHRSLPFGTILRVTNPVTDECLLVLINDRGPYVKRRVLDLSYAAATALNLRLGKIHADGFTPADVARDSLALVFIGNRYEPYRVPRHAFEVIEEFENFTLALRLHRMYITDETIALALLPSDQSNERAPLRYAVVRLSPLVQRDEDTLASVVP